MKILYLVPRYYPAIGGSENLIKSFAEHFAKEGHDVTVYTSDVLDVKGLWAWEKERKTIQDTYQEINGVKIYRFPINVNWLFGSFFLTKAFRKILQYVPIWQIQCLRGNIFSPKLFKKAFFGKEKFDVIHVTPIPYDSLFYCGYLIAKRNNANLVCTPALHISANTVKEYSRSYTFKVLSKFSNIITTTSIEQNFIQTRLPQNQVSVQGIGIDIAKATTGNKANFFAKHNLPKEAKLLFYVGTKCVDKGTLDVIKAFNLLKQNHPQLYLVLAGNELPDFIGPFKELDKERIIYYEGPISEEEKWDIFAAGDIMVMPSQTDSFGIVYLEAWANKKVVIGANSGGVPGVIDNSENGILIEFGDVEALKSTLEGLITNQTLYTKLAQNGFEKLSRTYTEEIMFTNLNKYYLGE